MGLFGKDGLFGGPNTTSPNEILLPSGKILVGNAFGRAQARSMSGQGAMDNLGALTLQGSPTFDNVTVVTAPTLATDLTNKAYVDMFVSGLTPLTACRVATASALTATYSNGTAGVGATLTNATTQAAISIDGVSLSAADRMLVKNQAAPAQNGIYTVTTVGSGATNWVLTRATDFDTSAEMIEGSFTNIIAGTANQGSVYLFTSSQPITVGTTALIFSQFGVFGTLATQNANAVAITGGSISGTSINIGDAPVITGILPNANTTSEIYSGGGNTPNSIVQRDADGLARANLADESSSAFQVITDSDTLNTAAHLAFVNNSGAGTQSIYTNPNLLYDAVTNTITANIIGAITGNASTATILATGRTIGITGDITYTSPTFNGSGNVTAAGTLATVNSNVGSFGSATQVGTFTVNGKGLITAAANTTITPAIGSITGLGTGIATALAINVGSTGAPVLFGGAGGTPSSIVLTNATGTAASLTAGIASTVSTSNEASDTTCFLAFFTASGSGALEPKNNTNLRYNASTNLLSANLATIDNGGNALAVTGAALTFGSALGAGNYLSYGGGPQFPRSTGVSSTGSLYHARNAIYNAVVADFTYGISGGGVTLLELSDTAINFKYAASGSVGNPITFTTGLTLSQSTGLVTIGAGLTTGGTTTIGGTLAVGTNDITCTGSLGATGARLTKGWFTDLQVTNAIAGSITGNAATASTISDTSDATCFPVFVNSSGTQSSALKTNTALRYDASANLLAANLMNIDNGGNALTGTNAALIFGATNALGDGNYINFGTGGRNIGVFNLGAFFITNNADYNATSDVYKYNSSSGATMMEFSTTSIDFKYAASGTAGNTITTATSLSLSQANGNVTASTGHLVVNTAGKTIEIKEGSNACKGTGAVMVGGAVTVSTTAVATGDMVNVSRTAVGGTIGTGKPTVTISNATSFTLTSSNPLDTSTYSWWIVKAA